MIWPFDSGFVNIWRLEFIRISRINASSFEEKVLRGRKGRANGTP